MFTMRTRGKEMKPLQEKSFGGTEVRLSDRERGAALVLVMILTGVALTLTAAMIYAVTSTRAAPRFAWKRRSVGRRSSPTAH